MIIVTGGAGFVGSNLVAGLNDLGRSDIVVVDDLTDGRKFANIADCQIADYWDKQELLDRAESGGLGFKPDIVFHQGACSTTTEWNGAYMMETNYRYSKCLLDFCLRERVQFVYASSAAVYGAGDSFAESGGNERPLNVYGYSKYLFDQYVRNLGLQSSQLAGLRYFNVYGPREFHKGDMASVVFHFNNQLKTDGEIRLFDGCDGYGPGEQRRDFIYVGDVVKVNQWFMEHPDVTGLFNVGTGRSQTFNEVGRAVLDWHGRGTIRYIPFPDHLVGRYQSFTEADIDALRSVGYREEFLDVAAGVAEYLKHVEAD